MTREEAVLRLEILKDFSQNNELKNMHEAIDMAIRSLSADVMEVVRCKDCKYHGATIEEQPTPSIMCAHMHDNDYCSYGKRREDDKRNSDKKS